MDPAGLAGLAGHAGSWQREEETCVPRRQCSETKKTRRYRWHLFCGNRSPTASEPVRPAPNISPETIWWVFGVFPHARTPPSPALFSPGKDPSAAPISGTQHSAERFSCG
jgi:hypothetical protein